MENGVSEDGQNRGKYDGDHYGFLHYVFSHKEGSMRFSLSDEMTDADGASLCHGNAEEVGEHDNVDAVGTGGQCFDAQHIDEKGNHYLR